MSQRPGSRYDPERAAATIRGRAIEFERYLEEKKMFDGPLGEEFRNRDHSLKPTEEKMVPFINTYRGHRFTFDPIDPDAIDIWDIAHALSHQCRYAGHTNMLYSVAQHSLLLAERVPGNADDKLNALLHDAAEAYVCDLPSPLKKLIGGRYVGLHNAILSAIYHKYMGPTEFQPRAIVKAYDEVAVTFEAQAFFGYGAEELVEHGFDVKAIGSWDPWDPKEFASRTADAEPGMVTAEFLRVFEDLMQATGRSPE